MIRDRQFRKDLATLEETALNADNSVELKAQVDEDDPTIDSVFEVWPAAPWPEREIYDLFGITFNNHPDLRRIMMPDDWVGHPLRKDYPLGGEEVEFSHNVRHQVAASELRR